MLVVMEWARQVYAGTRTVAAETCIEAPPERVWRLALRVLVLVFRD